MAREGTTEAQRRERTTELDAFDLIRHEDRTGDSTIPEMATFVCTRGATEWQVLTLVWVAFRTADGFSACELTRTDGDAIFMGQVVPRQLRLAQWIEGGPPEVVVRVTSVEDLSDGGESSRSSSAEWHVCGLDEGSPVCWGSIATEQTHYDGNESCDEDGECEWHEHESGGRARIDPIAGDAVRVVPTEGSVFTERVVRVPRLPCAPVSSTSANGAEAR